ncbi:hypothetical protein K438DRAFT_1965471 [Mycena galopus ATCC 62051]|nr:hypothetical protein K438DRAFT_1965471 [Mycena galopus ATCC 62051]
MDSDEDADLAFALAFRAQEAEMEAAARKGSDGDEDDIVEVPKWGSKTKEDAMIIPKPGVRPLSFLGDRAQMERERLARQKRVRGRSPPPKSHSNCSANSNQDDEDNESGSEGTARKRARLNPPSLDSTARTFPTGAFIRIDNQHTDSLLHNKPDCIRLSEVLSPKDELEFAILGAFAVDAPWLYGFFARDTPVVLVIDVNACGAGPSCPIPTLKNIPPAWVRVCPPLPARGRYSGCMHMKFMLLFKKSGALRIVVSSANLVPHVENVRASVHFSSSFTVCTPVFRNAWRSPGTVCPRFPYPCHGDSLRPDILLVPYLAPTHPDLQYLFVKDIPPAAPGTTQRTSPPAGA